MCLIIHRAPNTGHVPDEIVEFNLNFNPDGFGIAWKKEGKLHFRKFAPKDWRAFSDLLFELDADESIEYGAHFRRATHGACSLTLAHPFSYRDPKGNEVLVFHNGIIDIATDDNNDDESDTSAFVSRVLARMTPRWWKKPHLKFLVEGAIGWSRLLVMTATESVRINEKEGVFEKGIWYSTDPWPWTLSNSKGKKSELDNVYSSYDPKTKTWTTKPSRGRLTKASEIMDDPNDGSPDFIWWENGHEMYSANLVEVDAPKGGGKPYRQGDVFCTDCEGEGTFYLIDGKAYITVEHDFDLKRGGVTIVRDEFSRTAMIAAAMSSASA